MGELTLAILFSAVALLILAALIAEAFGHRGRVAPEDQDLPDA